MDDEPLRRSRVLALIGTAVAIGVASGLVAIHDPGGPISELPLTLLGLVLVVLASGAAVLGLARVVLLTIAIRQARSR
jgi:hypothetical protein